MKIDFTPAQAFGPFEPHSKEWHDFRASGIGGSESASILGMSKYKTAYQLFLEKTGQAERFEGNDATRRGQAREPVIRSKAKEILAPFIEGDFEVIDCGEYSYKSLEWPFLLGNIDGLIVTADFEWIGLEIKTTTSFSLKQWPANGLPEHYWVQVQHYMAVTGLTRFFVICEVDEKFNLVRLVERDDEFIKSKLVPAAGEFHSRVKAQFWPDDQPATEDDFKTMFPADLTGQIVEADHLADLFKEWQALTRAREMADERLAQIRLKILAEIKDNKGATDGKYLATWSNRKGSESFDKDAFKKEFPDIYPRFLKRGADTRTFKIEVKK